jgi:hypothetical protein
MLAAPLTATRALGHVAVGLLVAVVVLAVVANAASARPRSCGAVGHGTNRVAVYVAHGKVSCATARHLIRVLNHGGGVFHQGRTRADSYTRIGRWRCGSGTGGGACIRRHTRPRQKIDWGYCGQASTAAVCKAQRGA